MGGDDSLDLLDFLHGDVGALSDVGAIQDREGAVGAVASDAGSSRVPLENAGGLHHAGPLQDHAAAALETGSPVALQTGAPSALQNAGGLHDAGPLQDLLENGLQVFSPLRCEGLFLPATEVPRP